MAKNDSTSPRICSEEGCDGFVLSRDLCGKHYSRKRKAGAFVKREKPKFCASPGCDKLEHSRGWCMTHYSHNRNQKFKAEMTDYTNMLAVLNHVGIKIDLIRSGRHEGRVIVLEAEERNGPQGYWPEIWFDDEGNYIETRVGY